MSEFPERTTSTKNVMSESTQKKALHGGGYIRVWGCVAAGGTGNMALVEGRRDSTKYQEILMFKGQSRHWSWREVGYSSKTTIQSIPWNINPEGTSRKNGWRFWNGHHGPQTWILLKICGEISNMPYVQGGRRIFLSSRCSARRNGGKFKTWEWKGVNKL